MELQAWVTIAVTGAVLFLSVFTNWPADLLLLGGVLTLMVSGILSPSEAFVGFSNDGLLTVAILLVVTGALKETGAMRTAVAFCLGRPKSITSARIRMMFPAAFLSGFINNTPLVAILAPTVSGWAKQKKLALSQLLLPLNYAVILGGMCTLIGTSSTVAVNGLLVKSGYPSLPLFEVGKVGLPCAAMGILFLLIASGRLLRRKSEAKDSLYDARKYTFEMVVESGGALVGQTIEEAGLRHLSDMFLVEIHRGERVIAAVSPDEILQANDQLVFVGVIDTVLELQRVPGLKPATNQLFKLEVPRSERSFVEAVVSDSCRLIGKSIREGRFREYYQAVVIAVARNGERIQKRIGDIVLKPGDVLLIEAPPSFLERHRNSRDFYLVSHVEGVSPLRSEKAWLSMIIFGAMIVMVALGWLTMLKAGVLSIAALLLTRCCSIETSRRSVDYRLLLALSCSMGLGQAFHITGAAAGIAEFFIRLGSSNANVVLIMIYVATLLLSEIVYRNAAAVVLFPIAMAASASLGVQFLPFAMAIIVAASASFVYPLSYGPHLFVYGPGGYRFRDFVRVGLPLDILIGTIALLLIPRIWPLH